MCVQELKTLLVTKRDGREVEFQKEKIERAIFKAYLDKTKDFRTSIFGEE